MTEFKLKYFPKRTYTFKVILNGTETNKSLIFDQVNNGSVSVLKSAKAFFQSLGYRVGEIQIIKEGILSCQKNQRVSVQFRIN